MATAEQIKAVQDAYFAVNRATLNSTVAASVADAIAQGTTSLDAYIAAQIQSTASTTGAAVAISSFVTGVAPTSDKLTALKAEADKQVASYTALKVGNPALGAFEAFGRSFATDADTTAAFNTKYGSLSGADFINAVYFQVYGTAPSAGAFANLSGQLSYFNTILANVPNAALAAKGAVLGQIVGYAFISDASANSTLDNQVATFLTAAAKGDTSGFGKALPTAGNDGQSFSLTVSTPTGQPDVKVGGAANDTFNGLLAGSLETGDQLDGKGGNDVLNANLQGAANVQPQLLAIETLNFSNTGAAGSVDLSSAQGYTNVNITNVNVTGGTGVAVNSINSASGVKLGIENVANTAVGAPDTYTFTYQNAALAGSADVADLTLKNVGTAVGTANATAPVLVISGGAGATNGVEELNIHATGNARLGNLVVLDAPAGVATLNKVTVDGSGNFRTNGLDFAGANGTGTFDASKATGSVNVNFVSAGGDDILTVTGGSGNDRFSFGASLTTADKVDGGAGSDTLAVATEAQIVTGLQATNFETVEVGSIGAGNTLALARVTGATSAVITGNQNVNATITGLASNGSVEFQAASAGVVTATVTNATTAGTNDTLNVVLNNLGTAGSGVTVGGVIANGVENIVVNSISQSSSPANNIVNAINLNPGVLPGVNALENVTVKGTQDLNLGVINNNAKVVNAVDFTGDLTVTVAANGSAGVALTGGSGDDILTGGSQADVIIGGSGNDIIRGDVSGVIVAPVAQVSNIDIANAENGDSFTAVINGASVTYTWNGNLSDVQNAQAFATAINTATTAATAAGSNTGGANDGAARVSLTGPADGSAFTVTTTTANAVATNEVWKVTLPASIYDAGDQFVLNFDLNGNGAVDGGDFTFTGTALAADQATKEAAAGVLTGQLNADATVQAAGFTAINNGDGSISISRGSGTNFALTVGGTTNDGVTDVAATREVETVTYVEADIAAGGTISATIAGKAFSIVSTGNGDVAAAQLANTVNNDAQMQALGISIAVNAGANTFAVSGPTDGRELNQLVPSQTNDTTKIAVSFNGNNYTPVETVQGDFVRANSVGVSEQTNGAVAGANTQTATVTTTAGVVGVNGGVAADTITLGAGNDAYRVAAGESGFYNAAATLVGIDTVTDFNFGTSAASGRVDIIDLLANGGIAGGTNNAGILGAAQFDPDGAGPLTGINVLNAGNATAISGASLTAAVNSLFNVGGVFNTAAGNNAAGLFTYGTDTYLVITGAVAQASNQLGADDLIVKVTGYTGTLDASDFA